MRPSDLLQPRPEGLYCPPGDFFIDPVRPVERALITHGHSDHARAGHAHVLATRQTLDIMALRYGENFARSQQAAALGEKIDAGGVTVTFHPAGHVLGSAQIAVEKGGLRIVASGDYKRTRDATCAPFELVPCDVFITEATFALPVFRHPPPQEEIARLLKSMAQFPERSHLVGAYALGKAQRVMKELRQAGYDRRSISTALWRSSAPTIRRKASTSARWSRRRWRPAARATLPGPSSSVRPRPSPTAGRGASPIPSPASPRAGCASASAPDSAASNCR
jgi:DNA ligase-associated putative exonuclease